MKAYLLGKLSPSEADMLEDRYFADRKVLLQLKSCEDKLIAGYLSGNLSVDDREFFERRYLVIPELRQRLDDARQRRTRQLFANPWAGWRVAFFTGVLLLSVGVWTYREFRGPAVGRSTGSRAIVPALVVQLTPGVIKGRSEGVELRIPAAGGTIRFLLDAPGTPPGNVVFANLFVIGVSGERTRVWQSKTSLGPVWTGGNAKFAADIDSPRLHPGDYLLSLENPAGEVLENYLFLVSDSR